MGSCASRASRGRRPNPSKKPLAILGAALAVAGLVYMAYSSRAALKDVQSEVAVATTERDGLQAQLSSLSAIDAQAAAITARRGAVVTLAGSRLNWERVMRDTVTGKKLILRSQAQRVGKRGCILHGAQQQLRVDRLVGL